MVWNRIPSVCFYFVPRNGIQSCFLFHGMVRNGIPRVSYSTEQPEFRRNKPIVPAEFRLPRNNFFGRKLPTHCWGIREVARGGKYFLSYEGRAMKGEIWVERDKKRVEGGEAIEMLREKSGIKIRYRREGEKWGMRGKREEGQGKRDVRGRDEREEVPRMN